MTKFTITTPCCFLAISGGTDNFVVASAVAGFNTPENLSAVDGKVYKYFAQNSDGSVWELGRGQYHYATHTLDRTEIIDSSADLDVEATINFVDPPEVSMYPSPPSALEGGAMPSGTLMLFQQTTAPTGWTKTTTHDNKSLRVVSGTASSGGSIDFSSLFTSINIGNHTLTTAELAIHAHGFNVTDFSGNSGTPAGGGTVIGSGGTNNAGSGNAHNHPLDLSVKYVDIIIASKD